MCLLDHEMVCEKPSIQAAAALYLSFKSVRKINCWNAVMVKNTGYKESEVKDFSKKIVVLFDKLKKLDLDISVMKKYSKPKQLEVAKISLYKMD